VFDADFIVVGSDSGRIVILEYLPAKNAFEKVLHVKYLLLAVLLINSVRFTEAVLEFCVITCLSCSAE